MARQPQQQQGGWRRRRKVRRVGGKAFFFSRFNAVDEHTPLRGDRNQRWIGNPTAKICSLSSWQAGGTLRYVHPLFHLVSANPWSTQFSHRKRRYLSPIEARITSAKVEDHFHQKPESLPPKSTITSAEVQDDFHQTPESLRSNATITSAKVQDRFHQKPKPLYSRMRSLSMTSSPTALYCRREEELPLPITYLVVCLYRTATVDCVSGYLSP